MSGLLKHSFNNPAEEGLCGPHKAKFGPILLLMGVKPVFLTSKTPNIFDAKFSSLLNDAVSEGRLKCLPAFDRLDGRSAGSDLYYCQSDKVDDALELRSIFHSRHTRDLSKAEHVRVGQLLGYNDNDCALFGENRYTPEQVAYLRETSDIRRAQRYGAIIQEFEFRMRSDPESLQFP